jgi:hypothetical protein
MQIKDVDGCISEVPFGKECSGCPEIYQHNDVTYCMVVEALNSGQYVMRCKDCQKFRTLTDDEKININNDTYEVHCDCGTTWNMEDMKIKL